MAIKIFAGAAKGFSLAAPRNLKIRPTSVQLRRKLFDSIQDMNENVFIDLCCGTGAMGLEALSRGIGHLVLVDINPKLAGENIHSMTSQYPIETTFEVIRSDYLKWMDKNTEFLNAKRPILFFDPPYEKKGMYKGFMSKPLERLCSLAIIEGCEQKTMSIAEFEKQYGKPDKTFQQGTSYFLLYRFDVE